LDFSGARTLKVKENPLLKRNHSLLSIPLLAIAFLLPAAASRAQNSATSTDTAISQLASHIAEPLQKMHATKVVFADLKGPDGQLHPVGRWLADQLANSCNKDFPGLEIIIRPQNEEAAKSVDEAGNQEQALKNLKEWARSIGANVVVEGSFARTADGIGVSLRAFSTSDPAGLQPEAKGLVPFSDEIARLSPEPVPSPKDGVPHAGMGGASVPQCIHCPPPNYSSDARKAHFEGTVVLQVVITTDGRAINIKILKDPGNGLGMKAVESVRKWKFKPAIGPDGKPLAVIVPIEVTFRLYNDK
jgi:TonB family protein